MFRKTFFTLLFIVIATSVATMTALGQGNPVRGEVKLQQADGTTVPVAGALVEAFRTDIERGKMPDAKTDKRGGFSFVSFPLGQMYALAVSGPGIAPKVLSEIKGGMENIRSEEHTSELQSQSNLVCRLLLEK